MKAATPRDLTFASMAEVRQDVETLRANGYAKAGNWNLAQVCKHLGQWISFPVTGYPKTGPVMTFIIVMLRNTLGKRSGREILRTGKFPSRWRTLKITLPPPDTDEAAAIRELDLAIARWEQHAGEFIPSPLFGRLTREEWLRMQLIHCAHHLSHLVPKAT